MQGLQKKLSSSNRQKQIKIDRIFTRISKGYDLMNDIMSFGLHRIWKKEFIDLIEINQNNILIDLATGSGDLLKLIKKE